MSLLRVYVDTSVIGGCFDVEFAEYSNASFESARKGLLIPVVSNLTLVELSSAPAKVTEVLKSVPSEFVEEVAASPRAILLANAYMRAGVFPRKSEDDALHIATATINHVDAIVSWNFKHFVNLARNRAVNAVNTSLGFVPIEIRTPREVISK
jgi:predicted nucleic acid-binding protein